MTNDRQATLEHLTNHPDVPVLILGGGVNGCGLFRELALQGVDCLLVDKADFVAGASSKSSRMIHGGLRYLETREFRLVRESLAERNRLLTNAPHYVTPLKTSIPLSSWLGGMIRSTLVFFGFKLRPAGRGRIIVKFGLTFYDLVTRKNRKTPKHYFQSKSKSLAEIPGLNPNIVATATYWDAEVSQAERLCVEMLQDGQAANPACRVLNYVRPAGVDGADVTLRDEVTGERLTVRPQVVVNAAGAWVDSANADLGLETHYMGPTKGSHLVIDCPELYDALGDRMVYYEHDDGRVCIAFRFGDRIIMGSTDLRVDDPDDFRCEADEIDYMCATLRDVFPEIHVGREHIVYTFCGLRPLVASGGDVTATVSRGHSLPVDEADDGRNFPVCSMVGGKWTTFRAFAEQAGDTVLERLGVERSCGTEDLAIGGGRDYPADEQQKREWIDSVADTSGLSAERVTTLLDRYGTTAESYAASPGDETPLTALPNYTVGEIERLAATEHVVHLTDLICRRSTIAILGRANRATLEELAHILAPVLDWDDAKRSQEVEQALTDVAIPQ
jgi:glycerol-3-phosphate dehydrogenase